MRRSLIPLAIVVIILIFGGAAAVFYQNRAGTQTSPSSQGSASKMQVVAAENFWGSLVSQLGGVHVSVTSIVADPNVDPHEYETNPANARAITDARFVIVNGAGYDAWAINIVEAARTRGQVVLNVQEYLNQPIDTNPHFWYSPYFVNDTVKAMYKDLVSIDPNDTAYFRGQYRSLNSSLWQSYMGQEVEIRQHYSGEPVAATEDVVSYLANATGLKVVSPQGFMRAVAEGNDPPLSDVAAMEQLLAGGNSTVHLLVYNRQTATPLTQTIKSLAVQYGIPSVAVTETIQPPYANFQAWMGAQVSALQGALVAQAHQETISK